MSAARTARMIEATMPQPFAPIDRVPLARLPSTAWVDFMSGELTADDWALIGRVERGEITVDAAMAGRVL